MDCRVTLALCALLGAACSDGPVTALALVDVGAAGAAGAAGGSAESAGAGGASDARLCPGEPFGLGDPNGERMLVADMNDAIDDGTLCLMRPLTSDFGAHCDALSIAGALAFAGMDSPPFAAPGWHFSNPPDGSSRAWWAMSAEGDTDDAEISAALLSSVPSDFCMSARRANYRNIGASHVNRSWVVMFRN
jgi:hypothetical protein